MKNFFLLNISLASRGDAKNKGIFNSIDLKNLLKKRWSSTKIFVFTTSETA